MTIAGCTKYSNKNMKSSIPMIFPQKLSMKQKKKADNLMIVNLN